jgi:hypothetical protein
MHPWSLITSLSSMVSVAQMVYLHSVQCELSLGNAIHEMPLCLESVGRVRDIESDIDGRDLVVHRVIVTCKGLSIFDDRCTALKLTICRLVDT